MPNTRRVKGCLKEHSKLLGLHGSMSSHAMCHAANLCASTTQHMGTLLQMHTVPASGHSSKQ